jgi:hypothetical protein
LPVHVTCRYGGEHRAKELQKEAVYGLTELHREEVKKARLVANPGCYPTSVQLPLCPLLEVSSQQSLREAQRAACRVAILCADEGWQWQCKKLLVTWQRGLAGTQVYLSASCVGSVDRPLCTAQLRGCGLGLKFHLLLYSNIR